MVRALVSSLTFRIAFDGQGSVYAATSTGLYKTTANGPGAWRTVLQPDASQSFPPYTNQITDVAIRPGTGGKTILAVDGWRNGSSFNGFYLSTDGGASFNEITPSGAIDTSDIGRTTLAYAADGSRLYAIIESPAKLAAGDATNLAGVYVSPNGDPAGPYQRIANSVKLQKSGLGADRGELTRLRGGHPVLVQPDARRRPAQRRPGRGGPRGVVRDHERRQDVHHREPVLELRPRMWRRVPEHDASRPARRHVRG